MFRRQLSNAIKAFFILLAFPVHADMLTGHPRIIDGDTLAFSHTKVRLFGIDAPEHSQTCTGASGEYACGQTSLDALKTFIGSSEVTCIGSKHDRYKRLIATCYLGTTDINRWMVRNGYAVAYRKYSQT